MLLQSTWEVSEENEDVVTYKLTAPENVFPCAAEDGDDDEYDDGVDDAVDDDEICTNQDATILANKRIELKHEVSIAQSGHACHLLNVNIT